MATSSLLGIDTDHLPATYSATGIDSLGPSDASDSGSDSAGAYGSEPDSDTDRFGTGERSSVQADEPADAKDILPDHIENRVPGGPDDGMLDEERDRGTAGAALTPDDLPSGDDTEDSVEREDSEAREGR